MSAKIVCVIPPRWTLQDYSTHNCADRSHGHISRNELADSLKHALVEVVRHGDRRARTKTVVRVVRSLPARGLSCSVGEELATALRRDVDKNGWASTMVAQIRKRYEPRANPEPWNLPWIEAPDPIAA